MSAPDARTRPRRMAAGLVLALLLTACGSATTSGGGVALPSPSIDPGTTIPQPTTPQPTTPPASPAETPTPTPPTAETTTSPEVIGPTESPSPDPDTAYEETPIVPTQGTPMAVPFESAQASADGTEVIVRWWSGVPPCTALADVEVVEDDSTITITLFEASEHPDDAEVACIAIAQAKQHTVQLAAPVGDREIIDGAA